MQPFQRRIREAAGRIPVVVTKCCRRGVLLGVLALGSPLAAPAASQAMVFDWALVGDPMNPPDPSHSTCGPLLADPCGQVAHFFQISRFEVTNQQYVKFLQSVARDDLHGLYHPGMGASPLFGGILRTGAPGSYSYSLKPGFAEKPAVFVSFWSAVRFTNWLHNGEPSGPQGSATTEDGAYTLTSAALATNSVVRNPTARFFIPTEDEWYKAAFYDAAAHAYYAYPAISNAQILCTAPAGAPANSANCSSAAPGLTRVGAYVRSPGPHKTFDQGGNAFEWNETVKNYGTMRGLSGGSWGSSAAGLEAGSSAYGSPTAGFNQTGFRIGTW